METKIIKAKALEANERIRLAQEQIDVAGEACRTGASCAAALDLCARRIGEARREVDALLVEIEPTGDASPAMRACPACGNSIRMQATLCGFCWTKL